MESTRDASSPRLLNKEHAHNERIETASSKSPAAEIPWIDAWTRWERCESLSDDADDNTVVADSPERFQFHFSTTDGTPIDIELEGYHMESQEVWCSTGLTPWMSGEHLCHLLLQNSSHVFSHVHDTHVRILELGSGLGLCGIFLYHLMLLLLSSMSARTVELYLTDGDTDTLRRLRANMHQNTVPQKDRRRIPSPPGRIECRQLLWGRDTAQQFLVQQQQESGNDHNKFDIILGSDLIYVRSMVPLLWETVDTLLATQGVFYMAYCARQTTASDPRQVCLHDILQEATAAGFVYEECSSALDSKDGKYEATGSGGARTTSNHGEPIHIHKYWKKTRGECE